jgi:hypothetical protein
MGIVQSAMECPRGTAGLGQLTSSETLAAKIRPVASLKCQRDTLDGNVSMQQRAT